MEFFAGTFASFNIVSVEEFERLFDIANSRLTLKDPVTYSRKMAQKSDDILKNVLDVISNVKNIIESISFTTDIRSSRSMDSYFSLTFISLIAYLD